MSGKLGDLQFMMAPWGRGEPSVKEMVQYETMAVLMKMVGIGQVKSSQESVLDVTRRIKCLELIYGPMVPDARGDEYVPVSQRIVARWIGLTTNGATESCASFARRMGGELVTEAMRRIEGE